MYLFSVNLFQVLALSWLKLMSYQSLQLFLAFQFILELTVVSYRIDFFSIQPAIFAVQIFDS
jgi:hypothetical protein